MSEKILWTGRASLDVAGDAVIDGLARLELNESDGRVESWGGEFAPASEDVHVALGTAVTLMLTGRVAGTGTIERYASGVFHFTGAPPAPDRAPFAARTLSNGEVFYFQRVGYFEVVAPQKVLPEVWVPASELPRDLGSRMLLNYSAVEELDVPLEWLANAARDMEQLGLRTAIVASNAFAFGISRQALMSGDVNEGSSFRVFYDRKEAIDWLMAGG